MKIIKYCLIVMMSVSLLNCGSSSSSSSDDSSSTSSGTASNAYPSGLAIASPTASGDSSSSSLSAATVSFATTSSSSTFADKAAVYETIVAAASDAACQITLPDVGASITDPSCYGPALDYENHPDGADQTPAQLPTGDLGIWESTEDGNEACTAAKMNQLMASSGDKLDYTMLMAASMICLMNRAGTALPSTDGDSEDLTSDLNTAIQVNNSSVTITTATITNMTDIDDDGTTRDAYQFHIEAEDTGGSATVTTVSYMNHMPTASDNSTFKGRLWTEVEGATMAGDKDAVTIKYELASSTSLMMEIMGANYQTPTSSTVIFDSDGNIDVTGGWSGNISLANFEIDPSTGYGDFTYGWQAGNGDDKTRIFNGFTDSTGGCGFFGYGDEFDNSTGDVTDNVIDGFICNWAGPGNDHSMSTTANLAQKQCMTIDSTTGIFEPDTSAENITYAPTVSCDSSGSPFGIKLSSESTYDTSAISNDLVDLTSDTDYASYTAPTAPTIPSGL